MWVALPAGERKAVAVTEASAGPLDKYVDLEGAYGKLGVENFNSNPETRGEGEEYENYANALTVLHRAGVRAVVADLLAERSKG